RAAGPSGPAGSMYADLPRSLDTARRSVSLMCSVCPFGRDAWRLHRTPHAGSGTPLGQVLLLTFAPSQLLRLGVG
ncbi:MAG: hypothetical protein KIT58_05625, partial [Planctomycetota bacterium]|nr:hypothetical protein [Planctomycetota bacterium]